MGETCSGWSRAIPGTKGTAGRRIRIAAARLSLDIPFPGFAPVGQPHRPLVVGDYGVETFAVEIEIDDYVDGPAHLACNNATVSTAWNKARLVPRRGRQRVTVLGDRPEVCS